MVEAMWFLFNNDRNMEGKNEKKTIKKGGIYFKTNLNFPTIRFALMWKIPAYT